MKKIFIILLLLPFFCNAQLSADIGAGVDVKNGYPILKLAVGYQAGNVVIEANAQPSITRTTNSANYFGGRIGYNIYGIIPSIGGYYNYANADDTDNNGWHAGYSIKYVKAINENGGLFAEALYIDKSVVLTAGFNIQF